MKLEGITLGEVFVPAVVRQQPAQNPAMVYTWAAAGIYLDGSLKTGRLNNSAGINPAEHKLRYLRTTRCKICNLLREHQPPFHRW